MWLYDSSVLWHCWLGGRKGIRPVKNWAVGCWCGYLSGARCRLAYGPADATALTVSCFSKIQIGFTFLVPAHPGSPGKRAVKWYVCVCVCVCGEWAYFWKVINKPIRNVVYWPRDKERVLQSTWRRFDGVSPCSASLVAAYRSVLQKPCCPGHNKLDLLHRVHSKPTKE